MNTQQIKSDYQLRAEKFLADTNTTLSVEFVQHAKYWDDDKETRDIYSFTLTRGSRSYTARVGNSLSNSLYHISASSWSIGPCKTLTGPIHSMSNEQKVRASLANKLIPDAYAILACLNAYNPGTLDNFCSEYGYDTDSVKANKIYQSVLTEYMNLCALFTDKELETLQEIN